MVRQCKEMEALVAEAGDEVKSSGNHSVVKPLHKLVTEHKDVAKLAMQLNSAVLIHRGDVNDLLTIFSGYDELWTTVFGAFLAAIMARGRVGAPQGRFQAVIWFSATQLAARVCLASTRDISAEVFSISKPSAWRSLVETATSIQGQAARL